MTYLKFHSNLVGDNELRYVDAFVPVIIGLKSYCQAIDRGNSNHYSLEKHNLKFI